MSQPALTSMIWGLTLALAACGPAESPAPKPETPAPAAVKPAAPRDPPPKLVIVLVVDQMRGEMLQRFDPVYAKGLRRMVDEGIVYSQARHAHGSTYTAPGHATLSTGSHPSAHGIVGNSWVIEGGTKRYAASDDRVSMIGVDDGFHGAPTWLERDALGDWLRAAHPEAKVWSLALKDRAAVMMGGKQPNGALWWNDEPARYVSTSHYFETLPPWVEAFAEQWPVEARIASPWEAPEQLLASRKEDAPAYEGPFAAFPHTVEHFDGSLGKMARHTPAGERMNFALARKLIESEQLGADDQPDVLWLGASASDWIGHRFGPRSHEVEAYQRELDLMIGEFITWLDRRFPASEYLLVLTSDHGVSDIPESIDGQAIKPVRVQGKATTTRHLDELVAAGSCPDAKFEIAVRHGISLRRAAGAPPVTADDKTRCVEALASSLASEPWALRVLTAKQLGEAPAASDDEFLAAEKRSFFPGRSADVIVQLPPNHIYARGYTSGTGHGTAYTYDQRVPLIFFSPQLDPAKRDEPVRSVDLAPTLAPLLGVQSPAEISGRPIDSALAAFASAGWPMGPGAK